MLDCSLNPQASMSALVQNVKDTQQYYKVRG